MTHNDPEELPDMSGAGAVEYHPQDNKSVRRTTHSQSSTSLDAIRDRYAAVLMAKPGVTFVGVGENGLVVGVIDAASAALIPSRIEGVAITVSITGRVDAL